jgi:VCBS repeat-containing protein
MTGSVTEDVILAVNGLLTIIDPDAGEAAFTAGNFAGSFGSLELTQAGEWTYTLANANTMVQALGSGQSLQDIIGITSVDGTAQQITITINGSNEPSGNSNGQTVDGTSGPDQITTGTGSDVINAGGGNDTIFGGNGQDLIQAGSGNDSVHGGTGVDILYGDAGDDVLFGDEGKDTLHGGAGADEIHGGDSADTIFGDGGNDVLTGDAGNDTFVFAQGFGSDAISDFDFNPTGGGQDLLDISAFGITSATFASRVGLLDLGTDIQVTIDGLASQTITLENVQLVSNITQSDFILS